MGDREAPEENLKPSKKRKAVIVGILASSLLMLLGALGFRSLLMMKDVPPPADVNAVALVDYKRAVEAHSAYGSLRELKDNELRLRDELKAAMMPMKVEPPKVPEEPFKDSVWQKNAQNVIGTAAEILREKKKAAEEYRAATEAEYKAKSDEIDNEYLNAILNIQLKLQNSDNMRLSQEEIDKRIERRTALQHDRAERQMELAKQWEAEIVAYSEDAVKDRMEQLKAEARDSKSELELDAVKNQAEAQARNAAAMDEVMEKSIERQQERIQIFQELQETIKERIELESHIYSDIAGQTAKLAIMHHYTMVIASPAQVLRARIPWKQNEGETELLEDEYMPVTGIGTGDLTEELLTEIRKL